MFEVTRDRGVDIAEELILIGLFDVVERVEMVITVCIVVLN
jgi:hypothetical protein